MDSYIDLRLKPDPEFPATTLMNALFSKLHRGLATYGRGDIGISFPDAADKRSLGCRLRLHGNATALHQLVQIDWLQGMRDHVASTGIMAVPAAAKPRRVRRVQAKSSPERLRRRLVARKGLDQESARQRIPDEVAEILELPYVVLSSATTGQRFRLFIEQMPIQSESINGSFNAYGLSASATVPWF
ncbi:MAG: type I-F CRISPR-associated endoribonuclease Cas6/Csy4 [Pseudomonadota bacterium]